MLQCLFFIVFASAAWAAMATGGIEHVAPDGRFVISGDFTNVYNGGDKVIIKRGETKIGMAIVSSVYPTHMELKTITLESGEWVQEGDGIEQVVADTGVAAGATLAEQEPILVNICEPGGRILSYGDLATRGFRPGILVEIVRDNAVIGAAEVQEVGAHMTVLKLVGTAGKEVMKDDLLRVAKEEAPTETPGMKKSTPKRLEEIKSPKPEVETTKSEEKLEKEKGKATIEKKKGKQPEEVKGEDTPIEKRIEDRGK